MRIAEWSDDYELGERIIDKEHWGLFALIHDLRAKLDIGSAAESIETTMEALTAYVEVHFDREEALMAAKGYPDLENHKAAHAGVSRKVAEFEAAYRENPENFDYEALMSFLANWLADHILKIDMAFARFLREAG